MFILSSPLRNVVSFFGFRSSDFFRISAFGLRISAFGLRISAAARHLNVSAPEDGRAPVPHPLEMESSKNGPDRANPFRILFILSSLSVMLCHFSAFGLRISFGFRPSAFGFPQRPVV
ncbi:MAG TPA: hypothetical protein VF988_13715 [Verrucomicrobiae bacterium]